MTAQPVEQTGSSANGRPELSAWTVVRASVPGLYSASGAKPMQDANEVFVGDGWGAAVVADGAGSLPNSHLGARFVVESTCSWLTSYASGSGWMYGHLPSIDEWRRAAVSGIRGIRDSLAMWCAEHNVDFGTVGSTVIAALFSRSGMLVVHVGDGRAAVRDVTGTWRSVITPFKGEEVGATAFITSDIWAEEAHTDRFVPTGVVQGPIDAFALMSDGCERVAFRCYDKDDQTGIYSDPNEPFPSFFEPNCTAVQNSVANGVSLPELNERWERFLTVGSPQLPALRDQADDKTMVLGCLCAPPRQ